MIVAESGLASYIQWFLQPAGSVFMARVTVEDCVLQVPNRFELVMLAAQRARDIAAGGPLAVDRDNDKNPVVALREIADTKLQLDHLRNALIKGLQKVAEPDEPEDEIVDFLSGEQEMVRQEAAQEDIREDALSVVDEEGEGDELDPEADPALAGDEELSEDF